MVITGEISLADDFVSPFIILVYVALATSVSHLLSKLSCYELQDKENLESFGAWYKNLRIFNHSPRAALLWPTTNLCNRVIFCVAAVAITDFAWLQVTIILLS